MAAPTSTRCSRRGIRASSSAPRSPSVLFGDSDPAAGCRSRSRASDEQGPAPPSRPERYPGVNGTERYDEDIFVGYRFYDRFGQRPLFPFGYGLSYARFRFDGLRVFTGRHDDVLASVRVTNTSGRAGSTVAQAYVGFPASTGEPPQQLKGYEKVRLAAGGKPAGAPAPRARRAVVLRHGARQAGRGPRSLHALGRQLLARPGGARQVRDRTSQALMKA